MWSPEAVVGFQVLRIDRIRPGNVHVPVKVQHVHQASMTRLNVNGPETCVRVPPKIDAKNPTAMAP